MEIKAERFIYGYGFPVVSGKYGRRGNWAYFFDTDKIQYSKFYAYQSLKQEAVDEIKRISREYYENNRLRYELRQRGLRR